MSIRYDRSAIGIVIKCDECPWYAAYADTDRDADVTAEGHEARNHPGTYKRRNANLLRRTRHAARSGNV